MISNDCSQFFTRHDLAGHGTCMKPSSQVTLNLAVTEVHALHVANRVVVVGEGGEDALQPVVIWILIQVGGRVPYMDAVDAEWHLQVSCI